jgi:hypothetical protein
MFGRVSSLARIAWYGVKIGVTYVRLFVEKRRTRKLWRILQAQTRFTYNKYLEELKDQQ